MVVMVHKEQLSGDLAKRLHTIHTNAQLRFHSVQLAPETFQTIVACTEIKSAIILPPPVPSISTPTAIIEKQKLRATRRRDVLTMSVYNNVAQ